MDRRRERARPRHELPHLPARGRRGGPAAGGVVTGRVLVVDDDRSMCEMLEAVLQQRGFTVRWTTDAAEIPPLLEAGDADVVLTDLNMRGVSGLEVCERVAASR